MKIIKICVVLASIMWVYSIQARTRIVDTPDKSIICTITLIDRDETNELIKLPKSSYEPLETIEVQTEEGSFLGETKNPSTFYLYGYNDIKSVRKNNLIIHKTHYSKIQKRLFNAGAYMLPLKVEIVNNSSDTVFLKADQYIKELRQIIIEKQKILREFPRAQLEYLIATFFAVGIFSIGTASSSVLIFLSTINMFCELGAFCLLTFVAFSISSFGFLSYKVAKKLLEKPKMLNKKRNNVKKCTKLFKNDDSLEGKPRICSSESETIAIPPNHTFEDILFLAVNYPNEYRYDLEKEILNNMTLTLEYATQ